MVHDGAVKEQQVSASSPPAEVVPLPVEQSESSEAGAAAGAAGEEEAGGPSRPGSDKRLGVRHPVKYHRFRARGKAMGPGGAQPPVDVVEGEGAGEVVEEASSPEREALAGFVEVESVEMEVEEGGDMEVSPAAAVAVVESQSAEEEEEEVLSPALVEEGVNLGAAAIAAAAAAVPALEVPRDQDQEKERKEKERQRERERADEVGYMSGGCQR
jgi:protein phosphatase 1L